MIARGRGAAAGPFPAVRSLLAPAALAETVGAAYGLDEVRCRLIKATIRDVYKVEARQGPAVLCVYRHGRRTAEEIGAELDVLDDLAARGPAADVWVAPALRTLAGERIVALSAPEGVRHAVLFRFAEGHLLEHAPEPAVARRYGRTIARLHGLTDDWLRPHRAPTTARPSTPRCWSTARWSRSRRSWATARMTWRRSSRRAGCCVAGWRRCPARRPATGWSTAT